MLIRPATQAGLSQILAWPVTEPVGAVPAGQYRDELARHIYLAMPGDRDWWRLAYTAPGGQLAGMILPNRNTGGAVVGYLGVLPELRGRGYIDDLVAETTRFHAARGEPRIAATTDTRNLPMANAFERAGYRPYGIRYVLSEPPA